MSLDQALLLTMSRRREAGRVNLFHMFDFRFSEVSLTSAIALMVGPRRLPCLSALPVAEAPFR